MNKEEVRKEIQRLINQKDKIDKDIEDLAYKYAKSIGINIESYKRIIREQLGLVI